MNWTIERAEIWIYSSDITWTREVDGIFQRLSVYVSNDKMTAYANQWLLGSKMRSFHISDMPRQYLTKQEEITALWQNVYFNGEVK